MSGELYADRESINPRAFAVRHLVIQEVKFRKADEVRPTQAETRALLDRVARGVDVSYDRIGHTLIVRCEGMEIRRIPLDGMPLYARGDTPTPAHRPSGNVRHWDAALEENRRLVHELVNEMVSRLGSTSR